jgi:spermidine synthase
VELDPVVHHFAMKYFDLPGNHTIAIEDATGFVSTESEDHPQAYDYIIHDVFTGGAEPTALFTLEFLQGLEKMLKDDGVVAIVRNQ